jgi:hypothetical protein
MPHMDYKEHLALALSKHREAMLKDPDLRRIWMAALAVHVRQGGDPIDGHNPMLGDLLALEITREERKLMGDKKNGGPDN